jgi:hypothetical protein
MDNLVKVFFKYSFWVQITVDENSLLEFIFTIFIMKQPKMSNTN